jgi:hypothetical protein
MKIVSNQIAILPQSPECPCGQALVDGTCQTLIPAQIDISPLIQVYPFWMVYNNCVGNGCTGFEGENLNACNFGKGLCNNNPYIFTFKGKVVDSAGHPVCGVPLEFESSLSDGLTGKISWSTPDGLDEGVYSISTGTLAQTDINGEFSITYTVNCNLIGTKACFFLNASQTIVHDPVNWTITISAKGYGGVPAQTVTVEMNNTICEQNAL